MLHNGRLIDRNGGAEVVRSLADFQPCLAAEQRVWILLNREKFRNRGKKLAVGVSRGSFRVVRSPELRIKVSRLPVVGLSCGTKTEVVTRHSASPEARSLAKLMLGRDVSKTDCDPERPGLVDPCEFARIDSPGARFSPVGDSTSV